MHSALQVLIIRMLSGGLWFNTKQYAFNEFTTGLWHILVTFWVILLPPQNFIQNTFMISITNQDENTVSPMKSPRNPHLTRIWTGNRWRRNYNKISKEYTKKAYLPSRLMWLNLRWPNNGPKLFSHGLASSHQCW